MRTLPTRARRAHHHPVVRPDALFERLLGRPFEGERRRDADSADSRSEPHAAQVSGRHPSANLLLADAPGTRPARARSRKAPRDPQGCVSPRRSALPFAGRDVSHPGGTARVGIDAPTRRSPGRSSRRMNVGWRRVQTVLALTTQRQHLAWLLTTQLRSHNTHDRSRRTQVALNGACRPTAPCLGCRQAPEGLRTIGTE